MESLFWIGFGGVFYAYLGYPLVLWIWGAIRPRSTQAAPRDLPSVSVILPVHNGASMLPGKVQNILELDYPPDRVEILIISDGSTDGTAHLARKMASQEPRLRMVELEERQGKGNALNVGLEKARNEIIVFTDAGIVLEPRSLRALVEPFSDPSVGCVSGEDMIPQLGGEGLYGRYELFLRRQESSIHSLVGASGSFYAQRRELCPKFLPGLAPDFLSVLHVLHGRHRAISAPDARGTMKAVEGHGREFHRKVRTLVRGYTALFHFPHLLNPVRHGKVAFFLLSHKLGRWLVPFFLLAMVVGNAGLLHRPFYAMVALPHGLFYVAGAATLLGFPGIQRSLAGRIAAYFIVVHAAIAMAWWHFLRGHRMEVWSPSRR